MEINTEEINAAKEAGFTNEEIKNNFADEINAAKVAGFSDDAYTKIRGQRLVRYKIKALKNTLRRATV